MSTFLVLCPSHRDRRELALLDRGREHEYVHHDYASAALEALVSPTPSASAPIDIESEIERIVARIRRAPAGSVCFLHTFGRDGLEMRGDR